VWQVVKKTKNYTFSLPLDLLDRLKEHANEGNVPSVNFAVKEAIETYVVKIDKKNLYKQMKKASRDPLFMEDLESIMAVFSEADFETTRENKE
jgi:predicted DNA-binding protein